MLVPRRLCNSSDYLPIDHRLNESADCPKGRKHAQSSNNAHVAVVSPAAAVVMLTQNASVRILDRYGPGITAES